MESDETTCFREYLITAQLFRSLFPPANGQAQDGMVNTPAKQKMSSLKKSYPSFQNSINCQFLPNSVNSYPHQNIQSLKILLKSIYYEDLPWHGKCILPSPWKQKPIRLVLYPPRQKTTGSAREAPLDGGGLIDGVSCVGPEGGFLDP
jgi:hypothetical protein